MRFRGVAVVLVVLAAWVVVLAGAASAAHHTDNQGITVHILPINVLAAGADVTLTISTAAAGANPDPATATASLAWVTNQPGKKITAVLDQAMPDGVTLKVNVTDIIGAGVSPGASAGQVTLETTAVDVVTGISGAFAVGTATFTAEATAAAEPQTINRQITWTLQD